MGTVVQSWCRGKFARQFACRHEKSSAQNRSELDRNAFIKKWAAVEMPAIGGPRVPFHRCTRQCSPPQATILKRPVVQPTKADFLYR